MPSCACTFFKEPFQNKTAENALLGICLVAAACLLIPGAYLHDPTLITLGVIFALAAIGIIYDKCRRTNAGPEGTPLIRQQPSPA